MATATTNRAATGNTGSLHSRAFGQKGVAMTSTTFSILASRTFGDFSRYNLDVCQGRDGKVTYIVTDAEVIDPVTDLPAIIRQADTEEEAIAGLSS